MTIYMTAFDPSTKQCTTTSIDSGFENFEDVIATMGVNYIEKTPRYIVYEGLTYSDFLFRIDPTLNNE